MEVTGLKVSDDQQKLSYLNNRKKFEKKNEQSFRDLWDNKRSNIHVIGVPEIENSTDKLFEKYIPNLAKDINLQIQEVQKAPKRIKSKNPHRTSHNQTKDKENNLESSQRKNDAFLKGTMIQMTTDFSTETMEKWHNIFQGLKEKSSQNFISSENTFQK